LDLEDADLPEVIGRELHDKLLEDIMFLDEAVSLPDLDAIKVHHHLMLIIQFA